MASSRFGAHVHRSRWLIVLLGLALFGLAVLGVFALIEWRPDLLMETPIRGGSDPDRSARTGSLELISWNIGYAGLGRQADFFMDGGKQVRPADKKTVEENLSAIRDRIHNMSADMFLLQEVDINSSRSFGIDQAAKIVKVLPEWYYAQAVNFKVPWIPYPVFRPLGRVKSGLLSLSRYRPAQASRHQLPGSHPWPVRVFHLKRCLHELRIPAFDNKDWIVLHLHLSVFDHGGDLRRRQMGYLKNLMTRLHREGHHVIVGGDWNQALPGVTETSFIHQAATPDWFQRVSEAWTPPGWKWAFDSKVPSLRATNKPYLAGDNFVTIVDGFLVSPELSVLSVECEDLDFANTDHHPVRLKVSLP